jgi:hypothetical protein
MVDPEDRDWVIGEAVRFPGGDLVMHYRATDWIRIEPAEKIFVVTGYRPEEFFWYLGRILFLRQATVPLPGPNQTRSK